MFDIFVKKKINNKRHLCRSIAALITYSISIPAICGSMWDIEYIPESDYENAFGAGYYRFNPESISFYGSFHVTLADREPHYDALNISSFGDPVTGKFKDLLLFNIGATKSLHSNIGAYAGAGLAMATGIAEKDDPTNILSDDGLYYVDDPANDETGLNLNAGIVFILDSLAINVGYHSFPSSASIGIGGHF